MGFGGIFMRVVFMGSAELSCPSLMGLIDSPFIDLLAVISQPDRLRGRGRNVISICPTKELASERGIDVLTPENINDPLFVEELKAYNADVFVVVAYGQILRKAVLDLPAKGCINLHGSLLPKYRGAAPIQWAVANGEDVTGVTAMFMNEGMDAGDIIMQKEVVIGPEDTAGTLRDRMAEAGVGLLIETLRGIEEGSSVMTPQDEGAVTMAPKLTKDDGKVDWNISAKKICDRVRGFNPWPGCWTRFDTESRMMNDESGKILKVLTVEVVDLAGKPGEIVELSKTGPVIGTGDKALRLIEVQPEGGKVMAGSSYAAGRMKK